jgi:hypothetical protein
VVCVVGTIKTQVEATWKTGVDEKEGEVEREM